MIVLKLISSKLYVFQYYFNCTVTFSGDAKFHMESTALTVDFTQSTVYRALIELVLKRALLIDFL